MKFETVSATEAARGLGELLARVRLRRERFLIRRGKTVVAQLTPIEPQGVSGEAAARAWQSTPRLGAKEADAFAKELRSATAGLTLPDDPWAP